MADGYKAMVLTAPGRLELRDVARPGLRQGEALVRVEAVNLCPTDIKKFRDGSLEGILSEGGLILGHEIAGTVIEMGGDCGSVKPGDRVAIDPILRSRLQDGREHLKGIGAAAGSAPDNVALLRDEGIGGGFAELVKVPAANLIAIPDGLSFEAASLIEPLADIVHGLVKAGEVKGKSCAVFGLGPMGLMHVELLAFLGAEVVGVDPREDRRSESLAFGAGKAVAPGEVPAVDIAFIAAGGPALVPACGEALSVLAKEGVMVIFASGTKGASIPLDLNAVHYANQKIVGVVGFRPEDTQMTIDLLVKGAVDVKRIRHPLIGLDGLPEAFEKMGQPGTFKYGVDLRHA